MVSQSRLLSLVTKAAILLADVTGGRRRRRRRHHHPDEWFHQAVQSFHRRSRVTQAMTPLVALPLPGGLLPHLHSRLGCQDHPVRQSMFPSLPLADYLLIPP